MNIPGIHNVLNATAAITVALEEGIKDKKIISSMLEFSGVERRFDNLGQYNLMNINGKIGKILLIEDYGHHPTEILFTIKTIRYHWPEKRVIMIFQPHRYSRTKDLLQYFSNVLSKVDVLLILEIYASGENPIPGITSQFLCQSISKIGKINPIFVKNFHFCFKILKNILKNNDLILIQGAGNIETLSRKLIKNNLSFY